ncbi:unnamed protein product [Pedinophyceae sp. YPF-701]|nr:unnamed protein product [Pedinophyceae sp. YPF-701]
MGWGAVTGSCLLSLTAHHFVPPGTVQHWALSLSGLLFVAVVLPLLDVATGAEATSQPVFPSRPGEAALFQAVQLLVLPAHLAVVAAWVHAAATVPFNPLLWAAWFASTAAHGGVAFTAAHEGVHRGGWQGIAARILLASCCYGHWEQGHLAHHAAAGTERDAATARLNEPLLPDFLVRNVKGAWADGVAAGGRAGMARWAGASVAFGWAAALAAGPMGLAGFLACAASCITMLNFADYIEHYGLQFPEHARRRDPVSVTWDADWIASNCATFFLQRHSHHHRQPSRAYYALRSFRDRADAPKMPMSYPAMFLLAAVPPLWFRVMNPRVRQHQERVVKEMIDDINQAIDDNGLEAAAALRSN